MTQKFFRFIPENTNYDFVSKAPIMFALSSILLVAALVSIVTKGFNYSVDFTGGTEVQVRMNTSVNVSDVRAALAPAGFKDATVQEIGERARHEFLIRVDATPLDLKPFEPKIQAALNPLSVAGKDVVVKISEGRFYAQFDQPVDPSLVRKAIDGLHVTDIHVESVTEFGKATNHEYLVQIAGPATRISEVLQGTFGRENVEILQSEQVGPKVGKELRSQAIGAILISMIFLLIYVWFRFDFEFAPGAIAALAHDALVILGVFSFFQMPFDLSVVASVLTIVGFSVNDTIVLYDRIRENLRVAKDSTQLPAIINLSTNQTLSRTILTSGTVLLATIALIVMGSSATRYFSLAFAVGILSGTYSTVFIASPLTIFVRKYLNQRR